MINNIIHYFLDYFNIDLWTIWGLAGQGFFFLRMIIQWFRSEKEKKTIIPLSFWWLGLVGAAMLFLYAIIRHDFVFILTSILQFVIYYRNLRIALKHQNQSQIE